MPCGVACFALWFTSCMSFLVSSTARTTGMTAQVVDIGCTKYQGYYDSQINVTSFLSVRYAAPPIGNLRFQAPQPPAPEFGVQPATQNPNMCVQPPSVLKLPGATPTASEDCLFLNVFVPGMMHAEPVKTGGLPVLVWIHGGGYLDGYAAAFNGTSLVANSLNTVIVVVIQYRLGVFGFLSGNEVKDQGALNAGLLDQAFALQWVQDYIGIFGGDKSHVTIWGESAGAGSVLQHIIANSGNTQPPLFNAAIVSSTALLSQYYYNDSVPQSLYDEVVAITGCAFNTDTFGCLQSVDAEILEIANYALSLTSVFAGIAFDPVVDGTFIRERPSVSLANGRVNGQTLLAFYNANEGAIFVNPYETWTITEFVSRIFPGMTALEVEEAAKVYHGHGSAVEQAIMVVAESMCICPTYSLLGAFAGRSWKGLFAIPPAYHGNDIPYYFYSTSDLPPYDNKAFITAFSESFMSVAKYGDVNVKFDPTNITPHWNKYSVGRTEMLFNRTEAGAPVVSPIHTDPEVLRRCRFWASVTSGTAQ